ncbi:MAG: 5-formyltetrahydrofolate cyclo-ligase [Candidatus Binatia bacterium]
MSDQKKALRTELLWRRDSLPAASIQLWNRLIQERTVSLELYRASPAVALYSPTGSEVDTTRIRDHAFQLGKSVYYPRWSKAGHLELIRIESPAQLQPGAYGILEPMSGASLRHEERKNLLAIVPGVAFDLRGNRLGRGKGMYDRLLAQLGDIAGSVAVAYEAQIVEQIPVQSWDRKMDCIITEERIIDCQNGSLRLHLGS